MALPGENPIAVRVEEREGADAVPIQLSSLNPPENLRSDYSVYEWSVDGPLDQFVIINQYQSESVHEKRRTNSDPVIKLLKRARSARSAVPVNFELPPHVLISHVEGKDRRDTSKDAFLSERKACLLMGEKIRPISLPENGKKDYDHRFFSVPIGQRPLSNSWPPNLQLNPTSHDIIVLIRTVQTPVIQPGSAIPFLAHSS